MVSYVLRVAALVFVVCVLARWGVGRLTQVEEFAAAFGLYVASTLVAPTFTAVRAHRVDEVA